ncbi:hypothetical protein AB0C68_39405 [Streptomyces tendae]|uniref:hypothetical protein n=1 Tax=Streptomyces tendae TaxID=1932 RepID=UPI0033F71AC6
MLRAFVKVDRATMGPECLAAELVAYARLHQYVPSPPPGSRRPLAVPEESWRRRYPLFPRLLFVLDGTGPAGIHTRLTALHAAARGLGQAAFLRDTPVLATPMTDLLRHGPGAPIYHPIISPDQHVSWTHTRHALPGPATGAGLKTTGPTTTGHSRIWGAS